MTAKRGQDLSSRLCAPAPIESMAAVPTPTTQGARHENDQDSGTGSPPRGDRLQGVRRPGGDGLDGERGAGRSALLVFGRQHSEQRPARPSFRVLSRSTDFSSGARRKTGAAFFYVAPSAAFTRSGLSGALRMRTPVASNTALASADGIMRIEGSPAPLGATSGRSMSTISIDSGASGISRIG